MIPIPPPLQEQPISSRRNEVCCHCGTSVVVAPESDSSKIFCCRGCQVAYNLIHELGLESYYDRITSRGERLLPVQTIAARYEHFNDPSFVEMYTQPGADGSRSTQLLLDGIHCAACIWLLERLPGLYPGLISATLDYSRSVLQINYDPRAISLGQIATLIQSLGFPPRPVQEGNESLLERGLQHRFQARLGIAAFSALNAMLIAVGLYAGDLSGIEPQYVHLFAWVSLLVSLPSVLWCAWPIYEAAWHGLISRRGHVDIPISLALLGGFAMSVQATIAGTTHLYYDSVTALIFFLLVGRYVQFRTLRRIHDRSVLVSSVLMQPVRRLTSAGIVEQVSSTTLVVGDTILLTAGDPVPVDGRIVTGSGSVDMALLTGESEPIYVEQDDLVWAGARVEDGDIRVHVSACADKTRMGKLIVAAVSQPNRAPTEEFTARVGQWYTIIVLLLGAVIAALNWQSDDTLIRVLSLFVVACPCALAIATPLTFSVTLLRAIRAGAIVRGAQTLESLARVSKVFFDKTGTLTTSQFSVARIEFFSSPDAEHSAAVLRAFSTLSNHPVCRAIRSTSLKLPTTPTKLSDPIIHPGLGISAKDQLGVLWHLGRPDFASTESVEMSDTVYDLYNSSNGPVSFLSAQGVIKAFVEIKDSLRPEVQDMVTWLSGHNIQAEILSGDRPQSVKRIATLLGLPYRASVSPEEKREIVQQASLKSQCAFVGDGINDAGALQAASVGIAVSGGAEVSLAVADVVMLNDGPGQVAKLIAIARHGLSIVHLNLAISITYNCLGVIGACMGWISPLFAAILMPASSLTVIFIAQVAQRQAFDCE